MKASETIARELTDHIAYWVCGDGLREADRKLHGLNDRLIAAIAEEHGEAWVGMINVTPSTMERWTPERTTYGDAYVIPHYDAELLRLLRERDDAPYTGTADDYERITAIHSRIEEIGGHMLIWT